MKMTVDLNELKEKNKDYIELRKEELLQIEKLTSNYFKVRDERNEARQEIIKLTTLLEIKNKQIEKMRRG